MDTDKRPEWMTIVLWCQCMLAFAAILFIVFSIMAFIDSPVNGFTFLAWFILYTIHSSFRFVLLIVMLVFFGINRSEVFKSSKWQRQLQEMFIYETTIFLWSCIMMSYAYYIWQLNDMDPKLEIKETTFHMATSIFIVSNAKWFFQTLVM